VYRASGGVVMMNNIWYRSPANAPNFLSWMFVAAPGHAHIPVHHPAGSLQYF